VSVFESPACGFASDVRRIQDPYFDIALVERDATTKVAGIHTSPLIAFRS
jgi:hypothetical protein